MDRRMVNPMIVAANPCGWTCEGMVDISCCPFEAMWDIWFLSFGRSLPR